MSERRLPCERVVEFATRAPDVHPDTHEIGTDDLRLMAREILDRRAADLTDADQEALWWAAELLNDESRRRQGAAPYGWHNRAHAALAVLDRLLNGGK